MKLGIITLFVIGILLAGLTMTVFVTFYAKGYESYKVNIDTYNNTQFESMQKLDEINSLLSNTKTEAGIRESPKSESFFDVVGSYFQSGINSLKVMWAAQSTFDSMTSDAVKSLPYSESVTPFYETIKAIILSILIIGVFLAILIKWVI
jgi:hypothetical protein